MPLSGFRPDQTGKPAARWQRAFSAYPRRPDIRAEFPAPAAKRPAEYGRIPAGHRASPTATDDGSGRRQLTTATDDGTTGKRRYRPPHGERNPPCPFRYRRGEYSCGQPETTIAARSLRFPRRNAAVPASVSTAAADRTLRRSRPENTRIGKEPIPNFLSHICSMLQSFLKPLSS